MNLIFRRMGPGDIDSCHALLLHRFLYDAATYAALPSLWRTLINDGRARGVIVEDTSAPRNRIRAFGFRVFLSDRLTDEAFAGGVAPPYFTLMMTLRLLRGGASPFLFPDEVRRNNSRQGVNLFSYQGGGESLDPDCGEVHFFNSPLDRPVRDKFVEGLLAVGAGYRLRSVVVDAYGIDQLNWNLTGGFRIKDDYSGMFEKESFPVLHPDGWEPYLIGATREEALQSEGTILSLVFAYTPPRFFLAVGEQDLLEISLEGLTDNEAAGELCISLAAVRKRWQSIYDKITDVDPDFFDGAAVGAQKKRQLLMYLRTHPEELRPAQRKAERKSLGGLTSGDGEKGPRRR